MTKNTGEGQREIGDDGKKDDLRKEEQWRQLRKKKKVEQDKSRGKRVDRKRQQGDGQHG